MFTGSLKSRPQVPHRLGKIRRQRGMVKTRINFLMILVQLFQLALFRQGLVQCRISQVLFHIGMSREHPFNQPTEQPHLGHRPHVRQETVNLVKQLAKHGVFGG